ncbi:MAG: glycosyltransferase, partial [Staphylococcus epidermidis]|nr:glycosyltransferase [Staphylococcus epidermidis]
MKIRVIVPCYNEGEVVLKTYDKLTEIMKKDSLIKNYEYDLLFINDGSIDTTI